MASSQTLDGYNNPDSSLCQYPSRAGHNRLKRITTSYHERIPFLCKLPLPVIGVILALITANVLVWVAVGIVLHLHRGLFSTAILSYTLGLRHALDADHISAIDLMTRRLVASGQRPVTVGTFFSLGHSTIVCITSIVVAGTAAGVSKKFDRYSRAGSIIGTSVSASFLILLGLVNAYILAKLIQQISRIINRSGQSTEPIRFEGAGCLFQVFKRLFKLIDRPWKLYPVGILFGLGFDTSSEIALLGISSIQASKGTSIWLILIFPVLFAAGMCLLDTIDGALMMTLYTSTAMAKRDDPLAVLYYSSVLTGITVLAALVIGSIQVLSLALILGQMDGPFWEGVKSAGAHFDILGGVICGSFLLFGGLSVLVYDPWRRWIERRRTMRTSHRAILPATYAEPTESMIIESTREAEKPVSAECPAISKV